MSRRQPREVWVATRLKVWTRDRGQCVRCCVELMLNECHIDHICEISKGGENDVGNLRTLCRRCHVLRANKSHQGMISKALKDGIIPPDWRCHVWED